MILIKQKINKLLCNKIFWIIPGLCFFVFFVLKIASLFNIDLNYLSILTVSGYIIIIFLVFLFSFLFNYKIFQDRDSFIHQSLYMFSLGYSLKKQIFYNLSISILSSLVMSCLVYMFFWDFNIKLLLLLIIFNLFLFLLRLISFYLNLNIIFYISIVIILSSFLFPIFIFPNLVYIVKDNTYNSYLYAVSYIGFYFYVSSFLFLKMWREECIY